MDFKYCKFCQCNHPLTEEWWYKYRKVLQICKIERKEYRQKNKHKDKEYRDRLSSEKRDLNKQYQKEYRNKNYDKILQKQREYRRKDCIRTKRYERNKLRMATDIQYKLAYNLRFRLKKAVKHKYKSGSAVGDLGCTIYEFMKYIESKWLLGMSWSNWNYYGWHIDHIIPLSVFDLADREQLLKACHYTNLQPLWAKDNLKKGDKFHYS